MTDLPPLPARVPVDRHIPTGIVTYGYTDEMVRAYGAACAAVERERIAAWIEPQRNDFPAMGLEFAIRTLP